MKPEDQTQISLALQYLQILQDGRSKPDRNGGDFRESLDNIEDIVAVKEFINEKLNIKK